MTRKIDVFVFSTVCDEPNPKKISFNSAAIHVFHDADTIFYRDGYHYSLEQLAEFPDADDKIYRRGATDTFDPSLLARDLERIAHGKEDIVHIPGFDHALGDPVKDQHQFDRNKHKVVICEGLVSIIYNG